VAVEWLIRSEFNGGGDEARRAKEWLIRSEMNGGGDEARRAEEWLIRSELALLSLQKPKLCLGTAH